MEYIDRVYGKTEIDDPAMFELVGYPFGGRLSALRAGKGIYQQGRFVKEFQPLTANGKRYWKPSLNPKPISSNSISENGNRLPGCAFSCFTGSIPC